MFQFSISKQFKNIIILLIIGFALLPAAGFAADTNGATLFLSPYHYAYSAGEVFSVSVKLHTGGVAVNSAEAFLEFPAEEVEVKEISFENSIFNIWPGEPFYSNEEGFVSFSGGLPTPGFKGSSGTILTIFFEPKKQGSAVVNFGQGRVLADDGLGTNVLENTVGGFYFYEKPKTSFDLMKKFWILILPVLAFGIIITYLLSKLFKKKSLRSPF